VRRAFFAACLALVRIPLANAAEADVLRVMTFNIWVGGEAGRQPLSQTVRVIEAAQADLVGLQETRGERRNGRRPDAAREIAKALGWNYFDQGDGTGVISRFRIIGNTPKKWGVCVELPDGRRAWLFNVHLAHAPYQPYQLLKIPYHDAPFIATAEEAVAEAVKARKESIDAMLAELDAVRGDGAALFVTGDFNEPSPLDWTNDVCTAGGCPIAVTWPTAQSVLKAGFVDAYRQVHVDPVQSPGYTWTPTTSEDDAHDRHDRIDFVLVDKSRARVDDAQIIGESEQRADIVVAPYPSDHRSVVATVTLTSSETEK
jgi:exonuclease III